MPYIKKQEIPFAKMRRLLLGYGYNGPKLAAVLGCDPKTAKRYLDEPRRLTIEDLDKINKRGHVPLEEIREAL